MNEFQNFKALIKAQNKQLSDQFFDVHIETLLNKRACYYDEILTSLWTEHGLDQYNDLSLNAVGGFGRYVVHPKSDLDIAILYTSPLTEALELKVSDFVTTLWDLGIDIGHSVRSVNQSLVVSKDDITIETNLIDIRCIAGNNDHAKQILNTIYSNDISTCETFYQQKVEEQQQRHLKCNNTALFLEPNIKNNPGGMRDVQNIFWIAQKMLQIKDPMALVSEGVIKRAELQELMESYDFICRIRWALHCVAQRPIEVLTFDYQVGVAEFMKFGRGERAHFAVEKMMRQLYRAMTRIRELNQMILGILKTCLVQSKFTTSEVHIDDQFAIKSGLIRARYDEVFYDKGNVIKLFRHMAENPEINDIAPATLRLLRNTRRNLLGELQDYQICRHEFIKIVKNQNGLKVPLSLMHRYGVLAAYFPEWRAMEGQMQFDIHNAYTLDEHAFRLVQKISDFWSNYSLLKLSVSFFKQKQNRDVLVIAGLCHDLNGSGNTDSHRLSALVAQEFAQRHDFSEEQCSLIRWLIENQDLLLETAQTRDITDPKLIDKLAKKIGNSTRLNTLYCFTAADLMATNESAWNEWIESLLERLYLALELSLSNGAEGVYDQINTIRDNKSASLEYLTSKGACQQSVLKHWSELPPKFFRINQQQQIIEVTENLMKHSGLSDFITITEDAVLECSNLIVITQDRDGLFSDLYTTLSALKVKVKDAQLYKLTNGFVLEIFKILEYDDKSTFSQQRIQRIKTRVMSALSEKNSSTICTPLTKYDSFGSSPEIEFIDSSEPENEILKVSTTNNPLLISDICQAFYDEGITLHTARITTLGESCENVFAISDEKQHKLSQMKKEKLTNRLLAELA